jgi:hypothetical protein
VAEYTPPLKSNIPFSFSTGGYTPPDFGNLSLNFDIKQIQSAMSNMSAAVRVFDTKQETYTYLKYCDRYIIGYTSAGVQIIQGRCYYGGIRDIAGFIRGVVYSDLVAQINGEPAIVEKDLPAYIGIHPYYMLPAFIRGLVTMGLSAVISGMTPIDLGGYLETIQPVDLPGFIKARLTKNLPGNLHGWQTSDLNATIDRRYKADLRGVIGVIEDLIVLPAIIRGWVREAYKDLSTFVHSFEETFLPGFIRGTEYRDLGVRLVYIQPEHLPARIHGWQAADLQGIIDGYDWPWNLTASINGVGGYANLGGYIKAMDASGVYRNLPAYLKVLRFTQDFPAEIQAYAAKDLGAFLNSGKDRSNLPAEIYPKMIRLTAVLSIITMEHSDLVGVINASCVRSTFREMSAYIRPVYMKDLPVYIKLMYPGTSSDLGAAIGHGSEYITIDKHPIDVYVKRDGFRVEDKTIIYLNSTRSAFSLGAYIYAEPYSVSLGASINGERVRIYEFEYWKKKERVYDLHYGDEENFKNVDLDFETIVSEYLYSSVGNTATKAYIDEHWRTRLSSFYSPQDYEIYLTRLYKVKILFDLHRFNSIDEAIRYGIEYVTTGFRSNLSAHINCVGEIYNLPANILPKFTTSTRNNLTSIINGVFVQEDDEVVLGTLDGIQTIDI